MEALKAAFSIPLALSRKELFLDAERVPLGEPLKSDEPGFSEIFNEVFGFHDARLITVQFEPSRFHLETLLSYIVKWDLREGIFQLTWRKLRLVFDGISEVDFGYGDPDLGLPSQITRHINLPLLVSHRRQALPWLAEMVGKDARGAELDSIHVSKFGSSGLRAQFDWITVPLPSSVVPEVVTSSLIELEFISEASSRPFDS